MLDLVPGEPRVFPVGRLDRDTEGLLVLTNDGELAELLTHPRHGVEKEYFAEVEGVPSPAALRTLREGVELDDGRDAPGAGAARAGVGRRHERARDRREGRAQAHGAPHVRGGRPSGAPAGAYAHRPAARPEARARRVAAADPDEVRSLYAAALAERDRDAG